MADKALEIQEARTAGKLKFNIRDHSNNKKRQTTSLYVVNKVSRDGNVLKESNHTIRVTR